ncbi:carbohydrate ABC transporter permease [Flexilinea flocculi]|jgi:multiple sugar transport system permease protein|uniref:Carbohydrate ABC transporter membrane protein 2, CUT1 family n=1 Tax=Flexilinea flocculi TaxID=1678840 RepID=A0A0S7BSX0_9CHLR|nr:carbohydrate ABC transporter permease [Flexilinea flocculi]NMB94613.1 carbohydrate ABC transporter permease [Flexilinea flocculi]GAP41026.1 carbohydrate ABC transporter membrane protein 2, CUT1 family [Flexilinea flocculi]
MKKKFKFSTLLKYFALIILFVYIISPFLWLLIMSVSSSAELTLKPLRWIPEKIDFSAFKELLVMGLNTRGELFLYALRNSLVTAMTTVLLSMLVTIPAAWVFSRYSGKKNVILSLAIFTFMLPPVAYCIPLYKLLVRFDLMDKSLALAFVYCTFVLPFCVWLIKSSIDAIPYELEEAAVIDGAGFLQRIIQIVMPLLLPALGTVALMSLIMAWDEYFYAMLFTNSKAAITLPVVIANLASGRQSNYNLIAAGGVLASAPPVIIGMLFQKALIKGLVSGGVKE